VDANQYGEEAGLKNMNNISNINQSLFAKRKRANKIGLTLSMGAMLFGNDFPFLDTGSLAI
jgi:phosphate transport system permease protein